MQYYADYFDLKIRDKEDVEGWVYGLTLYTDKDGSVVAAANDDPFTSIQVVIRCLSYTMVNNIDNFIADKVDTDTFKRVACTVETGTQFFDAWIYIETSKDIIKGLKAFYEGD